MLCKKKDDGERLIKLDREKGYDAFFAAFSKFLVPFVIDVLKKVEKDDKMVIVNFGGIHTTFQDEEDFNLVYEQMSKFNNVILLQPSDDIDMSLYILRDRYISPMSEEANRIVLSSNSNQRFAKKVIYTRYLNQREVFELVDEAINKDPRLSNLLNANIELKTSNPGKQYSKHL